MAAELAKQSDFRRQRERYNLVVLGNDRTLLFPGAKVVDTLSYGLELTSILRSPFRGVPGFVVSPNEWR
ncbi:hypothetical protein [Aliiroseovarius sp. Z3]|uniref:hypothetical protein n=1 Tax=Aliiroseovarius sp. Z3 TaxID=2811402 RepID=UPI0023B20AC9|nr:hypothetical protein [Aliiroseovarius sp. Z3]